MKRLTLSLLALAFLAGVAFPQDKEDKPLVFNFKDASPEAVLQYVCREYKWTLVYGEGAKPEGVITAWNESPVPAKMVIEFLNTALAKSKVQLFLFKPVLKVVTEAEAKKGTYNIFYGCDPAEILPSDTMRTQIIPLKNINVVDVSKELKAILDDAASRWAINTYSNAVIVTEKASTIYRLVCIFKVLDVQAADRLKIAVFSLKYADATETAKVLNELFKKEQVAAQGGRGGFGEIMRMFGGGGGGRGETGPTAKTLAGEMVRITADLRTNSVVVSATEENVKIVKETIDQLDTEKGEAIRLKLYPLRYADAQSAATLITQVFAEEKQQQQNNRNRNPFQFNPFGGGAQPAESTGASREVKAVSDVRTNSIVVAANELNMKIVDQLVTELDRQLSDMVQVKIFKLKNAQAATMVTTLREVFRPQVTATQNAGRPATGGNQGGGGFGGMFGQQGRTGSASSTLAPAQEVEITSDTRTNSIIVKASEEYLTIAEQLITRLDEDPTEQYSTYVIPVDNANASELATILQNLLRGNSGTGTQNRNTQGGQLPGIGQNQNTQNRNTQNQGTRGTGGAASGTRGGAGGSRNLGPLDGVQDQDPPAIDPMQEDPGDRRGIEGQVDIQADAASNSLVVRTSPRNFDSIQNIVKSLDRMRPQVLIKVLIAEVTLDHNLNFGVEGFWENKFRVNGDAITQRYATDFNLATRGMTSTFTGDELQGKLNALAEDGRLKVLATPRILVLDNQAASISVGKEVPRVTNTTINAQGNPQSTVVYESLGIKLDVTPHINFDGLVTMDVRPEISDIAPQSQSVTITEGVTSPTFFVNTAQTVIAARTGQTIAIGGLIRESEEESVEKIPLLGDIPLIGLLFSNTVKKTVKRELMIFLTPYVAYNSAQLEEITEMEKSKLKLLDPRDIDSEGDRWLDKMKLRKE